jgi:hypothetical protein
MRIPDWGPFGETFFDARVRAITAGLFVKRPSGGCVESVVTVRTHFLADFLFIIVVLEYVAIKIGDSVKSDLCAMLWIEGSMHWADEPRPVFR